MTTTEQRLTPEVRNGIEFKVADLSLAEFGRKEIRLAEQEMPGLMALRKRARRSEAARGRAHHGQPAHDDADGGADRNAGRARRRRALGVVQHLLDPGSRRAAAVVGRPETAAPEEPEGHAGVRVEGRDARRVLVVHERGARVARRIAVRRSSSTTAATRRCSCTGRRVREGRRRAALRARRRPGGVGRDPRPDLRERRDREDASWTRSRRPIRGVSEETTTGVHPPVSDDGGRHAARSPPSTSTTR